MTEFTDLYKPTLRVVIRNNMTWTRLQLYDTGKVFYSAPYRQGKGVEYRILFNGDDSLEVLSANYNSYELVQLGRFAHTRPSHFAEVKRTMLISDKPQLLVSAFNFSDNLSRNYTKEFITELMQEYLDLRFGR